MIETKKHADLLILFLFFSWIIFGLVMLASASSPVGYARFNDTYYFIKKQILFGLLPGIFLFFIFSRTPYSFLKKISGAIYLASLTLLVLVFIPRIGLIINGARSWLDVFGYTFQPVELIKLSLIIVLATLLSDQQRDLSDWKNGLTPILAIISPALILILLQPDIGSLSILAVIIFSMLFLGGVRRIYLLILGLLAVGAFAIILIAVPYRANRLTTFLHPELDPKGVGYQINQAYLAVGSGGLWGLGLGHSRQKFQYLPEVQADSIFAIIAEEMGFVVSSLFVCLIGFVSLRGLKLAARVPDKFGRLLLAGIMVWFLWQSLLNIGSMVGVFPITGVPLPFVSHGGSALVVGIAAIGIVASISREVNS